MKKLSVIISFIILLFASCADKSVNPVGDEKYLKLNFTNGYCEAEGWVVLHSEDGQSVIRTIKFFGDSLVDFGELEQERVTMTIVTTGMFQGLKTYSIKSYFSVKKGTWTFSLNNTPNLGDVTVQMNFPTPGFDEALLSTAGSYRLVSVGSNSQTQLISDDVIQLNQDQTISLYGSVRNRNTNSGYYLWLPDQQFSIGNHNSYPMNLTKPLSVKRISANRPFSYINLTGYTSQSLSAYKLVTDNSFSSAMEQNILFPDEFPAALYKIELYEHLTNDYSYYYSRTTNGFVNSLSVPADNITASYNQSQKQFENIALIGSADCLNFSMYIDNGTVQSSLFWFLYTSSTVTKVKLPVIPDEITSQIPGFDLNSLLPLEAGMYENSYYNNLDEYIAGTYKRNNANIQLPGEQYTYVTEKLN